MPRRQKSRRTANNSNSLRIIGGRWRGRKLAFPDLPGLRPTPDRVRETLFNWLNPIIYNARCLDLFAGSGALSLEALSRGAGHSTIIDREHKAVMQLKQHLQKLECGSAELIQTDALQWLEEFNPDGTAPYDIIFLDPPFNQQLLQPCCDHIEKKGLMHPDGFIYIEMEVSGEPAIPESWHIHRQTAAGQVAGYLYRREA